MNRKVVGVLPNELEINLPPFISSCYEHSEKMREFIYNSGIKLYGQENFDVDTVDTISKLLADQGYLVFSVDENESINYIIIYVPEKTSPKQIEYFEKRKEPFKKYTMECLLKKSDNTFETKEQSNTDKPVVEVLIEELKKREMQPKEYKYKTLVREKNK